MVKKKNNNTVQKSSKKNRTKGFVKGNNKVVVDGNSYTKMYNHPLWQKKRLEIFKRDNFTCRCCGSKDKQLNVHHFYYEYGFPIWGYNNNCYVTICIDCHAYVSKYNNSIKDFKRFLASRYVSGRQLYILISGLENSPTIRNGYSIYEMISNILSIPEYQDRFFELHDQLSEQYDMSELKDFREDQINKITESNTKYFET